MNRISRVLVWALVAPVVVIGLAEIGFSVRSRLRAVDQEKADGNVRVLLVGDSILGNLDETETIAGKLQTLVTRKNLKISFSEISKPAEQTIRPETLLAERLKIFDPHIIFMMIGKSDDESQSDPLPEWILNFSLAPYLLEAKTEFLRQMRKWFDADSEIAIHDEVFGPAWRSYRNRRFAEAIPLFEEALMNRQPDFEVAIRGLNACYRLTEELARGQKYFTELAHRTRHRELALLYALSLKYLLELKAQADSRETLVEIEKLIGELKDQRTAFKARLWILKMQRNRALFGRQLADMTSRQSGQLEPRSLENIKRMVSRADRHGAHVILLQYPTDRAAVLSEALKNHASLEVIETRDWILEPGVSEAIDFVSEDIEHLTPSGAELVAHKLLEVVRRHSSSRSFESREKAASD